LLLKALKLMGSEECHEEGWAKLLCDVCDRLPEILDRTPHSKEFPPFDESDTEIAQEENVSYETSAPIYDPPTDREIARRVSEDGMSYFDVPETMRTTKLRLLAVLQNLNVIERFTMEEKRDVQKFLVVFAGMGLHMIPAGLHTEKLCRFACKLSKCEAGHVAEKFHSCELLAIAIANNGKSMRFFPEKFRTYDTCLIAVKQCGGSLQYVPKNLKDAQICEIAVSNCGDALEWVPEHLLTRELCTIAVENSGAAIQYVPAQYCDNAMYMAAVRGGGLGNVPRELQTKDFCEAACDLNPKNFPSVPDKYKTLEMCKSYAEIDYHAICYTPDKFITEAFCKFAVEHHGCAIKYVPSKFYTNELCDLALKTSGKAFQYFPLVFQTPERYEIAAHKEPWILVRMRDWQTPELCFSVVSKDGTSIFFIKNELITHELCLVAIRQNYESVRHIPCEKQLDMTYYVEALRVRLENPKFMNEIWAEL
jgi:hypothetical protein